MMSIFAEGQKGIGETEHVPQGQGASMYDVHYILSLFTPDPLKQGNFVPL